MAQQRTLCALERRFFADPKGARIWCVSDLVRREVLARWPHCAPLVEIHRNAVDVGAVPRAQGVGQTPLIVSVGRFKEPKDFLTLVRALGRLPDRLVRGAHAASPRPRA